jgi:hypothetical protein
LARNNQVQAARLLGVSRNIVRSRLMRYGMLDVDAREASRRQRKGEDPAPVSQTRSLLLAGEVTE